MAQIEILEALLHRARKALSAHIVAALAGKYSRTLNALASRAKILSRCLTSVQPEVFFLPQQLLAWRLAAAP